MTAADRDGAALDREALGFAVLFAAPVGAGVALAVLKVTAGRGWALALATGGAASLSVFLLVALAARAGAADRPRSARE